MRTVGPWLLGGAMSLIGLFGLYLAARAVDSTIYFAGIAVSITCVLFVFIQIRLGIEPSDTGTRETPEAKSE